MNTTENLKTKIFSALNKLIEAGEYGPFTDHPEMTVNFLIYEYDLDCPNEILNYVKQWRTANLHNFEINIPGKDKIEASEKKKVLEKLASKLSLKDLNKITSMFDI